MKNKQQEIEGKLAMLAEYQLKGTDILKELWWNYLLAWEVTPVTENYRTHIFCEVFNRTWENPVRIDLWPTTSKLILSEAGKKQEINGTEAILAKLNQLLGEANGLLR